MKGQTSASEFQINWTNFASVHYCPQQAIVKSPIDHILGQHHHQPLNFNLAKLAIFPQTKIQTLSKHSVVYFCNVHLCLLPICAAASIKSQKFGKSNQFQKTQTCHNIFIDHSVVKQLQGSKSLTGKLQKCNVRRPRTENNYSVIFLCHSYLGRQYLAFS